MLALFSQMNEATDIVDTEGKLIGVYAPMTVTADDARKLFDLDKARQKLATERKRGDRFPGKHRCCGLV